MISNFFKQKHKQKHMLVASGLTLLYGVPLSPIWAMVLVFFLMTILKEFFWDVWVAKSRFDVTDILANFIGVSVAGVVLTLIRGLFS